MKIRKTTCTSLFDKLTLTGYFFIFLLFEIPYVFAFYPGIITDDSCGQLLMCIWKGSLNNHHPIVSSLLMYASLMTGRTLFRSDNAGIFLYICFQVFFQSLSFAYCQELFKRKHTKRFIRIIASVFYCIVPIFMNMSIIFFKDTGYYISALLCLATTQLCFLPDLYTDTIHQSEHILWIISLLGLCVFRQEGRILVIIILILLYFASSKNRALLMKGVLVVTVFIILNQMLIWGLHIQKGSVREALSVPILITAAYVDKYPSEIGSKEAECLLSLFDITDISELSENIDYDISDTLKAKMQYTPDKKILSDYIASFIKHFFKHPGIYFETLFKHSDGYFNPLKEKYESTDNFLYILGAENRRDAYLDIYFPGNIYFRNIVRKWIHLWDDNIVSGVLYNPGTYTLLLIIEIIMLIIKRQFYTILWYMPAGIMIIVLILSPLNGSLRYALPLMSTMPLYLELSVSVKGKND